MKKVRIKLPHSAPTDLLKTLNANIATRKAWGKLTPLGRNEFICWVLSAKMSETRTRRIRRTKEELLEGKRRPCCWGGCPHR